MASKEEIIGILSRLKEGPALVSAADQFTEMVEAQEQLEGKLAGAELEKAVCSAFVSIGIMALKDKVSKQISMGEMIGLADKLVKEHGMDIDSVKVTNAVMDL